MHRLTHTGWARARAECPSFVSPVPDECFSCVLRAPGGSSRATVLRASPTRASRGGKWGLLSPEGSFSPKGTQAPARTRASRAEPLPGHGVWLSVQSQACASASAPAPARGLRPAAGSAPPPHRRGKGFAPWNGGNKPGPGPPALAQAPGSGDPGHTLRLSGPGPASLPTLAAPVRCPPQPSSPGRASLGGRACGRRCDRGRTQTNPGCRLTWAGQTDSPQGAPGSLLTTPPCFAALWSPSRRQGSWGGQRALRPGASPALLPAPSGPEKRPAVQTAPLPGASPGLREGTPPRHGVGAAPAWLGKAPAEGRSRLWSGREEAWSVITVPATWGHSRSQVQ